MPPLPTYIFRKTIWTGEKPKMKRIVTLCLAFVIILGLLTVFPSADTSLGISAKSAVLIDADSGSVLYESNAREPMGMASTTKIMTALTVLKLCSADSVVTVPGEAVGTEGSSVYLCEGERLTVEQLLYALLLSSANDAAVALAIHSAGSVEKFSEAMNEYADELGIADTNFTNPHGLYDENHYTTALSLALIAREALKNELLRKIFSTYKTTIPFNGTPDRRLLVNHNKLLRTYDGAIGLKTGFTKKTGRTLVSAAEREGLTLIAVTLNAPDDWRDHAAMLDYGFENYERRVFYDAYEYEYYMPATGADTDRVRLTNSLPLALTVKTGECAVKERVLSSYRFAFAPCSKNTRLGTVELCIDGRTVSSPLVAAENVFSPSTKKHFRDKLLKKD